MGYRASHVFRWDLDKTYLRSEFETVRDLVKSALEDAADKQAYPGAASLLRSLRSTLDHRICIVSGSPSQMRKVLSAKLALDGIEYDEFVLKNNLRNLMRGRLRALRAQVPYKLPALLESRTGLLGHPPETLFGDDAEADAIIYSLYADILAGRVDSDTLLRVMQAARAYPDEIDRTLALAEQIRPHDSVQRILIHLDKRSPTAAFEHFGARVVPIYNYFQAAVVLFGDGILSARQVAFVGREMIESEDFSLPRLANSFQDLLLRGRIDKDIASRLALELQSEGMGEVLDGDGLPTIDEIAWEFAARTRELGDMKPREWPAQVPHLDYVDLVDREFHHRTTKKKPSS
jgi:hypothetical protein